MVVDRAEDASSLHGHHTHPKLVPAMPSISRDGERTGTTATIAFIDPQKKVPAAR